MMIQRSFTDKHSTGTLYLVATPIGNLEDMTYRAVRTLKEVQWIAAEDTRQTRKLTAHFEITAKLVSYHEHNKQASGPELIRILESGDSIALVSDAGLPAISDPGHDLVVLATARGIPVVPIPGANAALSALIISGLPTERFLFVGFLPRDKKSLAKELEQLGKQTATLIFYEAPHRLEKTLEAMLTAWGDRSIAVVRELTKKHEEVLRGPISECLSHVQEHGAIGEYCLVVEGASNVAEEKAELWWETLSVEAHVAAYVEQGLDSKEAIKRTAADRSVPKREIYNRIHRV
jgi:16S rRNA (cytidine1402-2'-O)-methyltransferase